MQRLTISHDDDLAAGFDAIVRDRSYASRSEAMRDLVRKLVDGNHLKADEAGDCVACLSYVYSHRTRSLAEQLLDVQHANHDLIVSTTHTPLDYEVSLEAVLLRGPTHAVRTLTDEVITERGVRFGAINIVSVTPNDDHVEPALYQHRSHAYKPLHRG